MPIRSPTQEPVTAGSTDLTAISAVARMDVGMYGLVAHGFRPAPLHRMWIDRLHAVMAGTAEKRNLLVIAPPNSAKTTWMSLILPPWYLGNHPDHHILFLESSHDNAGHTSNTVMGTLESNELHRVIFPDDRCRPNQVRGWSSDGLYLRGAPQNERDPSYRAVGYGNAIIGARANGIILDDPLTQRQSRSEIEMREACSYFALTVMTRLDTHTGWVIVIMTRWSNTDMACYLMERGDFDVLVTPVYGSYSWGTNVWPRQYPDTFLAKVRAGMTSGQFACVYLANPTELGGDVFRSETWLKPLPLDFDVVSDEDKRTHRERCTVVQFWDLAQSSKTSADYTAAVTIHVDATGRKFITDATQFRVAELVQPDDDDERGLAAAIVAHIIRTRPHVVGIERGAYATPTSRALVARVGRLLHRAQVAVTVKGVRVATDKVTRASYPANEAEQGFVYVDRQAPWWPMLRDQCLSFPRVEHDDLVDALSGAVQIATEGVFGTDRLEGRTVRMNVDAPPTTSLIRDRTWMRHERERIIAKRRGSPIRPVTS